MAHSEPIARRRIVHERCAAADAPTADALASGVAAATVVHENLSRACVRLSVDAESDLVLHGKLMRPLVAYAAAMAQPSALVDDRFWYGALAIELAHEASLLHDDILDAAPRRRGEPTVLARCGVGEALLRGDHLLALLFKAAGWSGSLAFVQRFAKALEDTARGEREQNRRVGAALTFAEYEGIVADKSGGFFGCALALAPLLRDDPAAEACFTLGRRLGTVYQMLDDLLDFCPAAPRGKPALQDYAQGKWTWPLAELDAAEFGLSPEALLTALFTSPSDSSSPASRALRRFEAAVETWQSDWQAAFSPSPIIDALLDDWLTQAADGVRLQMRTSPPRSPA